LVAVVVGVTAAAPALFETTTVYTAVVACDEDGNGMSTKDEDDVPTALPSLRHAQVVAAEPPVQDTDKVSEAPLATTGLAGLIEQLDGIVTPLPASGTVPVNVLHRVSWSA